MNEEVKEAPAPEKDGEELKRMTFGEHLEELRGRLFKCVAMLLVTFMACMLIYEDLVWVVTRPHFWAMGELQKSREAEGTTQGVDLTAEHTKFIAYAYTDPFFAMIKLAFIVGLFILD